MHTIIVISPNTIDLKAEYPVQDLSLSVYITTLAASEGTDFV